jgi:HD-GYP domain-containing protein (c-di-GMP phosphodiesterase class II)
MLVPLVEMVSAIARALDLVHPAVTDHHRRVTAIAVALAEATGLPPPRRTDLAIAASLHDAGAVEERSRLAMLNFEFTEADGVGRVPSQGAFHRHGEEGYLLLRDFQPFARAARLIRHHHTPWAHGAGVEVDGVAVEPDAHVLGLADRASVLPDPEQHILGQRDRVIARVRGDAGAKFRPDLVEAFADLAASEAFWLELIHPSDDPLRRAIADSPMRTLDVDELLALAEVFARLIDFRSPFTASHSDEVGRVAEHLGVALGMDAVKHKPLRIAGLLHDLGKLGIPPAILDKPGRLSEPEMNIVRAHPYYTHLVLREVGSLDEIRGWAAFHHQRIDGRGYPFRGVPLDLGARIVAVADVYAALAQERPYRPALSPRELAAIVDAAVADGALDGDVVRALHREVLRDDGRPPTVPPPMGAPRVRRTAP